MLVYSSMYRKGRLGSNKGRIRIRILEVLGHTQTESSFPLVRFV